MLTPDKKVLENLVRGYANVLVYGGKSSGKTTMIKKIFQQTDTQYIYINCILTDNRRNFLELFNFQFRNFLQKKCESFFIEYDFPRTTSTIQGWIKAMRKVGYDYQQFFSSIGRLYIFLDKIQELNLSEKFLSHFYQASLSQLKYIKFSFFMSGVTNKNNLYTLEQPFRSILTFCMEKPSIKEVIEESIDRKLMEKRKEECEEKELRKFKDQLKIIIYHKFESLQSDLELIRKITDLITTTSLQFVGQNIDKFGLLLSSQEFKNLVNKIAEIGPINCSDLLSKKNQSQKSEQEGEKNFYEYYPNLLLAAIHLAEGGNESEDKRRFFDYKKTAKKIRRNDRKEQAKQRVIRNNLQRIVSIAQVLESQTKGRREKQIEHHSLDFYGCIEYLISEGKLNYTNRNTSMRPYGGKVIGKVKDSEVLSFMKQIDLNYTQFMG